MIRRRLQLIEMMVMVVVVFDGDTLDNLYGINNNVIQIMYT